MWSAGMPQYGQLGHGTDHEHNTKDSMWWEGGLGGGGVVCVRVCDWREGGLYAKWWSTDGQQMVNHSSQQLGQQSIQSTVNTVNSTDQSSLCPIRISRQHIQYSYSSLPSSYSTPLVLLTGSIKLAYTPQPTPRKIEALDKTTVTNIACGHNHTIVSDEAGLCWSWGMCGGGMCVGGEGDSGLWKKGLCCV